MVSSKIDYEHHVVYSMDDLHKITKGYCFYIISEPGMPWGIYGISGSIRVRYCQYLMNEKEAVLWKGVLIYTCGKGTKNVYVT